MSATKHILFVMGILGLIGAFIPFVEVKRSGIALELTAKELSFGLEKTHKAINYQLPKLAEAKLPPDVKSARDDIRLVAQALKFSIALFIPLGLVLLIGIRAQYQGRIGRGFAALGALAGLVSVALWFVLRFALDYGLSEIALQKTTIALQLGAHVLLIAGIGAALGGILGVVKPDPPPAPRAPAPPLAPPPMPPPPGPAPVG